MNVLRFVSPVLKSAHRLSGTSAATNVALEATRRSRAPKEANLPLVDDSMMDYTTTVRNCQQATAHPRLSAEKDRLTGNRDVCMGKMKLD